jgi:hypothetical protein
MNRLALKTLLMSVIGEIKGRGPLPNSSQLKKQYKGVIGHPRCSNKELVAHLVMTFAENGLADDVAKLLQKFDVPHGLISKDSVEVYDFRLSL